MTCKRCGKVFYRGIYGNYEISCKEIKEIDMTNKKYTYKDEKYKIELCHDCSSQFDKFMRCKNE